MTLAMTALAVLKAAEAQDPRFFNKRVWHPIFHAFYDKGLFALPYPTSFIGMMDEEPWRTVAEEEDYLYHLHATITFEGLCPYMPEGVSSPAGPFREPLPNCPTKEDLRPDRLPLLPSILYAYLRTQEPSPEIMGSVKWFLDDTHTGKGLTRCPSWRQERVSAWKVGGAEFILCPKHAEHRRRSPLGLFPTLDSVTMGGVTRTVQEQWAEDVEALRAEVGSLLKRVPDDGGWTDWTSPNTHQLFRRLTEIKAVWEGVGRYKSPWGWFDEDLKARVLDIVHLPETEYQQSWFGVAKAHLLEETNLQDEMRALDERREVVRLELQKLREAGYHLF